MMGRKRRIVSTDVDGSLTIKPIWILDDGSWPDGKTSADTRVTLPQEPAIETPIACHSTLPVL